MNAQNSVKNALKNSASKSQSIPFSPQAITLTAVLGFLALISIVGVFADFSAGKLFAYILGLLFAAITIYDTQCLVGGGCIVWSWIRTVLYCILPIVAIIAFFMSFGKEKKEKQEKDEVVDENKV